MNIFEKHFNMLRKNQEIFEQYKMIESAGIRVSDIRKPDYLKFGRELLAIEKSKQFMQVRSVHHYNVVMKTLEEYTLPEWIVCLEEEVLLEYAIPIFSRVLESYPMLCGMNNEWEVLYEITRLNQEFWRRNTEWKEYFNKIIDVVFLEYRKGAFIIAVPDEYLNQFQIFQNM